MNTLRRRRWLLRLLFAWSIFLSSYLLSQTPQFTYWFWIPTIDSNLLCAENCDCDKIGFLADRVWSVRDLSAPSDCLCFETCEVIPSPYLRSTHYGIFSSNDSQLPATEQIIPCSDLRNITLQPYLRTTVLERNVLVANRRIARIETTRRPIPVADILKNMVCKRDTQTGRTRVETKPALTAQPAKPRGSLPQCGRDKTCLSEVFVRAVIQQALEKDKITLGYLLQDTFYSYGFKILPEVECRPGKKSLVIYIHTHPNHYQNRDLIRRTWGKVNQTRGLSVLVVFGVGITTSKDAQEAIEQESQHFGDILQGDFKDTYRNLTYKHAMGLRWLYTYCSESTYFLKIDDDVVVNIYRLADLISDVLPWIEDLGFYCSEVWPKSKSHREGKWNVTKKEYRFDGFPGSMCPGRAYLVPTTLALQLAVISSHVRFIWLDDVWVTSFLGTLVQANYLASGHAPFELGSLKVKKQFCFYDMRQEVILSQYTAFIKKWQRGNASYVKWAADNTPPCGW